MSSLLRRDWGRLAEISPAQDRLRFAAPFVAWLLCESVVENVGKGAAACITTALVRVRCDLVR